jgi:hypothetical protein
VNRAFFTERRDQLLEIALDLAVAALFIVVWLGTRDIPRLAQWLPEVVSVAGLIIVAIKLVGDGFALAKPPRKVQHGATRL